MISRVAISMDRELIKIYSDVYDAKACATAIADYNSRAASLGTTKFPINWPGDVADMAVFFAHGAQALRARFGRPDIPAHFFGQPFPGFNPMDFKTKKNFL